VLEAGMVSLTCHITWRSNYRYEVGGCKVLAASNKQTSVDALLTLCNVPQEVQYRICWHRKAKDTTNGKKNLQNSTSGILVMDELKS
jgi:hypothetical protein